MKVAVIILGRIDQKEVNLKILEECDVYIHTDDNYKQIAEQLNPVKLITTETSYWQDTKNIYFRKVFGYNKRKSKYCS